MPVKKTTSTETAKAAEKKPAAKKTVTKAASKSASENKTTVKKTAAVKPKAVKEAEKAAEKATEKKAAAKKSTAAKPKAVKETTKTAAKKTAAKKTTAKAAPKAEKAANEVAVKPAAEIVAVAVEETAPVKKTSKKVNREVVTDEVIITPVKEATAQEKQEVKPAEKPAAKKAPAKKAAAKKAAAKKAAVKKPVVQGSAAATAAAKATEAVITRAAEEAKKAAEAKAAEEAKKARPFMELTDEKLNAYKAFDNGTLLEMANALGLGKDMESLKNDIQSALDLEKLTLDLEASLNRDHDYVFEEDGFDETVLPVLIENIAKTLPHKASDAADLIGEINAVKEAQLTEDGMKNADLYNRIFDLVKQVLMTAQNNNMHTLAEVETIIPTDLRPLVEHFMDIAYNLLPYWQYNDVKFYEGFIYALISQFNDLKDLDNRAMMDVADLYIKHGDYGRGDADYNYVIRENNLKDYIYFRFANVYRPIDFQKAKAIASSALQYVDGRYDYYPAIMEILNS